MPDPEVKIEQAPLPPGLATAPAFHEFALLKAQVAALERRVNTLENSLKWKWIREGAKQAAPADPEGPTG